MAPQWAFADKNVTFLRSLLPLVTGWLCLLVSLSFFTLTYDSAHVKLTLFQIGTVVLLALWGALKISERKNPFSKKHLLLLAPFLLYGLWQIICFICFPYKIEALEEFVRLCLYGVIIALITSEFTEKDIRTVTRFIVWAAWFSFAYGLIQIVAIWFPSVDIMQWKGFFGKRIFSTHANPNFFADFIVFSSCIIGADYFIRRKKSNLILLAMGLVSLIFSETKGAWLAYAATLVAAAILYSNFFSNRDAKQLRKINLCAIGVLVLAVVFTGYYSVKRFQSVSFRTHTWQATWEMIKQSPVVGTGPGSFKILYPRYRHPQIFYIENAHNNETQHAENEYLEQWAIGGIVGLVLFLGMFGFLFFLVYKKLKNNSRSPLTIYTAGYACAVFAMLVHMTVDVSIHFVSSGFLMSVFIGILLALSLSSTSADDAKPAAIPAPAQMADSVFLPLAKLLLGLIILALAIFCTVRFSQMIHTMVLSKLGEYVMAICAWLGFLFCAGGVLYLYGRTIWQTHRWSVLGVLALSLLPIYLFYNVFCANHYYSVGVALTRLGSPEGALDYFTKAIRANPLQTEYRQYRGNVLAQRLNLTKTFSPLSGDTTAPSNDYERALKDFAVVLKRAPYHALIHHDAAQLYYMIGVRYIQASQNADTAEQFNEYQQLTAENFEQARRALEQSLRLDPVNSSSYAMLISMALLAHDISTAQYWIDTYRQGPKNVTEEEFLERHKNNPQIEFLQQRLYALQNNLAQK